MKAGTDDVLGDSLDEAIWRAIEDGPVGARGRVDSLEDSMGKEAGER